MQTVFRASQRGAADHGWLQARHSFSFAHWYEPSRMGFGALRVLNEDVVAPHSGFATHGHRDMEIVTYLLGGTLWHKDSMGHGEAAGAASGVIQPGEVQRMSAGRGVMHSEFNHGTSPTHLLQIWLLPRSTGGEPSYEQATIPAAQTEGRLCRIAAPADALVRINSDAVLLAGRFSGPDSARLALAPGRLAYVHLARGQLTVNGERLQAGDALQIAPAGDAVADLHLAQGVEADVLVFDLGRTD